ncbi:MAG: OmpH family outer membrane protein [Akkermansia sp.]
MKFPIITTALVSLAALAATAQAELKVASVNVRELYTMYYKRFDTENVLQKQLANIKADVKVREDKLRALQEDAKKIRDKHDTSLSESAVAKLRDEYNAKLNEIKAADQELKDFVQRRSVAFRELRNREMRILLEDVQNSINSSAEAAGADIVVDAAAISVQQDIGIATSTFPYIKKAFDITPEVLKKLNADAPKGFDPEAELKRLYSQQPQQEGEAPAAQ